MRLSALSFSLALVLGCVVVLTVAQLPEFAPEETLDFSDLAEFSSFIPEQDEYNSADLPGELVYVERRAGGWRSGKRQGGGPEPRYVCRPSRDDLVRLLLALHDARGGTSRTVNFCNFRRPASNVLTNLRFLGRKR